MAAGNIDVLNTALDLNLVNVDREQAAGSFSIDLVAEDEGGGTVIIETQLEESSHDHLGKLITYPSASSLFRSFFDLTNVGGFIF
jgi:RecB family endonuclease NucS